MTHSACHFILITKATQGASWRVWDFYGIWGQATRKILSSFHPQPARLPIKNQRHATASGISSIHRDLPFGTRHRRTIFNAGAMQSRLCHTRSDDGTQCSYWFPVQTYTRVWLPPKACWNCPFLKKKKVDWRFQLKEKLKSSIELSLSFSPFLSLMPPKKNSLYEIHDRSPPH